LLAQVLRAPSLAQLAGIAHGFSLRLPGTQASESGFAAAAGVGRCLRLRQVHGARVVDAGEALAAGGPLEGDALVGGEPGIALTVATADCVPLLVADPDARVVGAIHAGWRGLRARVIPAALEAMARRGADPRRLRVGIGPAVRGSCYEVGDEVRGEFEAVFGAGAAAAWFRERRLDLIEAAIGELTGCGVTAGSISIIERCTHCEPTLASYRREGSGRGTNLAAVALAPAVAEER
jgi:YfiH family protein